VGSVSNLQFFAMIKSISMFPTVARSMFVADAACNILFYSNQNNYTVVRLEFKTSDRAGVSERAGAGQGYDYYEAVAKRKHQKGIE
jgi:hypothetical protein